VRERINREYSRVVFLQKTLCDITQKHLLSYETTRKRKRVVTLKKKKKKNKRCLLT